MNDWILMNITNEKGDIIGSLKLKSNSVDLRKTKVEVKNIKGNTCVLVDGNKRFTGYIDDIRINEHSATPQELRELAKKMNEEKVIFT